MAWIKEQYAEEVAVLATWIVTVLPWSVATVSYAGDAPVESLLVFFRFPLFELQARFPGQIMANGEVIQTIPSEFLTAQYGGVGLLGNVYLGVPVLRLGEVAGLVAVAQVLWSVAALVTLALFVLSVAMYRRESVVRAWLPRDYVTVTRVGFAVLAVTLAGATAALAMTDAPYGTPVPIGVVLLGALAVVLWRAEHVPADE
jgi:hypothetical protein